MTSARMATKVWVDKLPVHGTTPNDNHYEDEYNYSSDIPSVHSYTTDIPEVHVVPPVMIDPKESLRRLVLKGHTQDGYLQIPNSNRKRRNGVINSEYQRNGDESNDSVYSKNGSIEDTGSFTYDSGLSLSSQGERTNPLFVPNDSTTSTNAMFPQPGVHESNSTNNSKGFVSAANFAPISFLPDAQKENKTSLENQKVYKKYPMYLPPSESAITYLDKFSDSGLSIDTYDDIHDDGPKSQYISKNNTLERLSKSQTLPGKETDKSDEYHERTTLSNPDLSFISGLRVPENIAGNRNSFVSSADSGINTVKIDIVDENDSLGSIGSSSKKVSGDSGLSTSIESTENVPSTSYDRSSGQHKQIVNVKKVNNNALDNRLDDFNEASYDVEIAGGSSGTFGNDESHVQIDYPKDSYFTEKKYATDSLSLASESSRDNNSEILNDIERNIYPVARSEGETSSILTISDQFQFLEEESLSFDSVDVHTPKEQLPQVVDDDIEDGVDFGVSDDPLPEKEDTTSDLYVHLHVTKERIKEFMDEVKAKKENEEEGSDGENTSYYTTSEDEATPGDDNKEAQPKKEKRKKPKRKKEVSKPFKLSPLVLSAESIAPGEGPADMAPSSEVVIDVERILPPRRTGETARIVTNELLPGITEGAEIDETKQPNETEEETVDNPDEKVQITKYLPQVKKKHAAKITMAYRMIYILGSVGLVIGAMAAFYALNLRLVRFGMGTLPWALTVYGVVTMGHYISESFFAVANKIKMTRLGLKVQGEQRASYRCKGKVALQIVGYREDPDYFRNCIISARDCYGPIYVLCVVVDGHEEQDAYMAETITEVFGHENTMQIVLDDLAANIEEEAWKELVVNPVAEFLGDGSEYTGAIREEGCEHNFKVLTIRQFHEGKRSVMHCAMRLLIDVGIDYIMMTDSDTLLEPNCLAHLTNLLESDDELGAVTGNVGIFNANESPISFLSAVKYWYAFNIERAAQSLFGVVSCVSGPLGLYRTRDVKVVLHDWYFQTFLGVPCTYGDDRHLTNRILSLGRTVKYTHLATCTTETPTQLIRWIVQQTRWTKSFFRELGFNLWWAFKVNFYLTWVLLYQGVYPFFVSASIITLLFSKSPNSMGTLLVVMVAVSAFRATLATILSRQPRLLVYIIYSFLYVLFMIPTKMHAVLMLWDTGWGTSSRLTVKKGNPVHLTPVILWCSLLVTGVLYNLITNLWI